MRTKRNEEKQYSIEALDRGLRLLQLFLYEKRELTLSQIASALGEYKSTVLRTLSTLEARGFVERNTENERYWLGPKTFALGMLYSSGMRIKKLARPFCESLANEFRETVHLAVLNRAKLDEGKVLVIDKIETSQVLRLSPDIGSDADAHASAVGKVLLASLTDEEVSRILARSELRRYTPKTICTLKDLLRELQEVRRQGYAVDNEELEVGLTCVAAPIVGPTGHTVAAVSLSGPSPRLAPILSSVPKSVMQCARRISDQMA
ncbi:MAG: IclR family transcriptional regulator [Bacillota bacterium]